MQIVALSDTHGYHDQVTVPDGDVIVHAGDFTHEGHIQQYVDFLAWFEKLPHKVKILCPGNHDFCCERTFGLCKTMANERGILIGWENEFLITDPVTNTETKFFCFPWTKYFGGWAFNAYEDSELDALWQLVMKIPEDTDFLITHGPPYDVLDESSYKGIVNKCGSKALLARMKRLTKLKYCVFGHIHEGYGTKQLAFSKPPMRKITSRPICINATLAGGKEYGWHKLDPSRKPFVLEL